MSKIEHYLRSCCELSRLCSRSGCIDYDSLRYAVVMENSYEIVIDIEFDELLLEGSRRMRCSGQLHLYLDQLGRVIHTEVL